MASQGGLRIRVVGGSRGVSGWTLRSEVAKFSHANLYELHQARPGR